MTRDKDFKRLVRAHMAETGQNYTSARSQLLALRGEQPDPDAAPAHERATAPHIEQARAEHERIVGRFIVDGRLVQFPTRRKARASVLLHLVRLFGPGQEYTESQVNELLLTVVDDQAFWRRELVEQGYLLRAEGRYWLPGELPQRTGNLAQEVPAWEMIWLPDYLRGKA